MAIYRVTRRGSRLGIINSFYFILYFSLNIPHTFKKKKITLDVFGSLYPTSISDLELTIPDINKHITPATTTSKKKKYRKRKIREKEEVEEKRQSLKSISAKSRSYRFKSQ